MYGIILRIVQNIPLFCNILIVMDKPLTTFFKKLGKNEKNLKGRRNRVPALLLLSYYSTQCALESRFLDYLFVCGRKALGASRVHRMSARWHALLKLLDITSNVPCGTF